MCGNSYKKKIQAKGSACCDCTKEERVVIAQKEERDVTAQTQQSLLVGGSISFHSQKIGQANMGLVGAKLREEQVIQQTM